MKVCNLRRCSLAGPTLDRFEIQQRTHISISYSAGSVIVALLSTTLIEFF